MAKLEDNEKTEDIAQPVCPSHLKSGKFSESKHGIGVYTGCGVRLYGGEDTEGVCQKEDSGSGDDPRDEDCTG